MTLPTSAYGMTRTANGVGIGLRLFRSPLALEHSSQLSNTAAPKKNAFKLGGRTPCREPL
jgi:hypothetical protein